MQRNATESKVTFPEALVGSPFTGALIETLAAVSVMMMSRYSMRSSEIQRRQGAGAGIVEGFCFGILEWRPLAAARRHVNGTLMQILHDGCVVVGKFQSLRGGEVGAQDQRFV